MITHRKTWLAAALAVVFVALTAAGASWAQGLDPASVTETIADGGSTNITKTVHTPVIPPKVDIYFLADSTGSMGPAIANVQANASTVLSNLIATGSDVRFGAGDYKDFNSGDPYAFNDGASIPASNDSGAAALAAIGAWSPSGGGDGPEAQFFALHQIATGAVNFRSDATKMVVWFGDAPGHDPVCSAISGLGSDITETSLISDLQAAGIRVVAISLNTGGYAAGLNDDSTLFESGYDSACGTPTSETNQAANITAATGGVDLLAATPDDVTNAIKEGISAVKIDVAMTSDCSSTTGGVVNTSFSPATQTGVTSGDDTSFTETISVTAAPNQQGQTYECDDEALINGKPMVDEAGAIIKEHKTVTVPDSTAPVAACAPTTNPNGNNVPKAPGNGAQGQNQDGFYQVTATDNVDSSPQIFVKDSVSGDVFGPYASGTNLKITQAPGATPASQDMGSANGQAGAITAHLTIQGDAQAYAKDASGNTSAVVSCLVPPAPK